MWGSVAFASQDACVLQDYDFIKSGDYILMNFTDETQFGPAPDCGGHVTILCPDDRKCVLPYAIWEDTLIVGTNLYDMNFKLIGDNRLIPQNDANWEEVLARNGCPTLEPEPEPITPVCSSDNLNLCNNQTTCEIVGGHWYNAECNVQEQMECPECQECPECPTCDNITIPDAAEPFVCPLVSNVYKFDTPDISYSLSNFRYEIGPGCRGTCDLIIGDSYYPAPFSCQKDYITIFGLSCSVRDGSLTILVVEIAGYYYYNIGNVTYCFPEKKNVVVFETE